mgnify:CR=1 FL=1
MTDKLLHFVEGIALPFFIFASAGGYEIKFLVEKWLALWDKTRFFPKKYLGAVRTVSYRL